MCLKILFILMLLPTFSYFLFLSKYFVWPMKFLLSNAFCFWRGKGGGGGSMMWAVESQALIFYKA